MKKQLALLASTLLLSLSTSLHAVELKDEIRQVLKENPEIIYEVIQENPVEFMAVLQTAVKQAEQQAAIAKRLQEQKEFEAAFSKPFKPLIRKDEAIRGAKDAPLVLVEYSDFQCPFCQRGYNTVMQLMKKYPGKIQFIYKHLPLDFHAEAMPTSHYYEALRMQSNELAFKFHDAVFQDISKLKQGEPYLQQLAQQVGADMKLLAKTLKERKDEIHARIQQDMDEARKFGMTGTPGFLLNGIPLRGAYPIQRFEQVIRELQRRNLAKL
jgi:protein-disulfide isomerase